MATKYYRYKTDRGRYYAVRIDEKLGVQADFGWDSISSDDYDTLPKGIRMRMVRAISRSDVIGLEPKYRAFPVGDGNAMIIKDYGRQFSYKGVIYKVVSYIPERREKTWQPPLQA